MPEDLSIFGFIGTPTGIFRNLLENLQFQYKSIILDYVLREIHLYRQAKYNPAYFHKKKSFICIYVYVYIYIYMHAQKHVKTAL